MLKQSGAYPRAFGEFVTEQFKAGQPPVKLAVDLPDDLSSIHIERAPFDWAHADLQPLRDYLLQAKEAGKFVPQPGLPL